MRKSYSAFKQTICRSIVVTVWAESGVAHVLSLSLIVTIWAALVDCTPRHDKFGPRNLKFAWYL